jgi:hypothetical protein
MSTKEYKRVEYIPIDLWPKKWEFKFINDHKAIVTQESEDAKKIFKIDGVEVEEFEFENLTGIKLNK